MATAALSRSGISLLSHSGNNVASMNEQFFPDVDHINTQEPLVVSPYTDNGHLLQLDTIDPQSQLVAQALTKMQVLKEEYATATYISSFNWPDVIDTLRRVTANSGLNWRRQRFYVVIFRSRIPPTTNYGDLGALDKAAHAEATASGGFLKYWFGSPDSEGRNLATCIWCSKEAAKQGGVGPAHRKAAGAARHLYTEWAIETLGLIIEDGIKDWRFTSWVDEE